jgi:hypothetical protein
MFARIMTNSVNLPRVRTVNAGRYQHANAIVGMARCNGVPIAFRRVVALNQQPGSFATQRFQAITPKGITPLSGGVVRLLSRDLLPLN